MMMQQHFELDCRAAVSLVITAGAENMETIPTQGEHIVNPFSCRKDDGKLMRLNGRWLQSV